MINLSNIKVNNRIKYLLLIFPFLWTISYSQNWVKLNQGLGIIGDVYLYNDTHQNELYLYGLFFSDHQGTSLRGISKWDGQNYISIAGGGPLNPIVYGIIRFKNYLYLSTWLGFDSTLTHFYYWAEYNAEENKLDTLNVGPVDGNVLRLREFNNYLYSSGLFKKCGSDSTWGICRYDGTVWNSLYSKPNPLNYKINTYCYYKNQFYVGGQFFEVNNLADSINHFGILEDGELRKVGTGFNGTGFTNITTMLEFQNELYIGGFFLDIDGNPANYIVRWDGTQFKSVGGSIDGQVIDMIIFKNNLYVAGDFTFVDGIFSPKIARWDGNEWHGFNTDEIDSNNVGQINDLEIYNNELYISGHFYTINGDTFNHVAKYNHQLPGDENELEVFINNPNEEIIIQFENSTNYSIAGGVFTPTGQQVSSFLFPNLTGYTYQSIPIPGLASGVYIVTVMAGDKIVSKKLLKI